MVFVNLLVDQLSGQFITFLVGPKKFTRLKDRAICFGYSLLSILDIRECPIFKKHWTKNSREWTKKMSSLWDRTIFFWPTKKTRTIGRPKRLTKSKWSTPDVWLIMINSLQIKWKIWYAAQLLDIIIEPSCWEGSKFWLNIYILLALLRCAPKVWSCYWTCTLEITQIKEQLFLRKFCGYSDHSWKKTIMYIICTRCVYVHMCGVLLVV